MSLGETLTNRVPARNVGLLLGMAVFFGVAMLHSIWPAFSADEAQDGLELRIGQPGKIAKGFSSRGRHLGGRSRTAITTSWHKRPRTTTTRSTSCSSTAHATRTWTSACG